MKKKENTWSGEEKETRSKKNDRDETLVRRSVYIFNNNNQSSRLGCLPDGPIRPNKLMLYFSIFAIEPPIHAPKPP
jgi:hypothetical protein